MSELDRGTDRAGRRWKRFLSPSQKYEIWLQLVRQEVTIAEAAAGRVTSCFPSPPHPDTSLPHLTHPLDYDIRRSISADGHSITAATSRPYFSKRKPPVTCSREALTSRPSTVITASALNGPNASPTKMIEVGSQR